jgi:hypothetical protein
MARLSAPVANGWNLLARLAGPDPQREAITSNPCFSPCAAGEPRESAPPDLPTPQRRSPVRPPRVPQPVGLPNGGAFNCQATNTDPPLETRSCRRRWARQGVGHLIASAPTVRQIDPAVESARDNLSRASEPIRMFRRTDQNDRAATRCVDRRVPQPLRSASEAPNPPRCGAMQSPPQPYAAPAAVVVG